MGLAMAEDTLPYVLHKAGITESKIFSLCFRVGGGIFTLGSFQEINMHMAKALSISLCYFHPKAAASSGFVQ